MKMIGISGAILGILLFILLSVFVFCSMIINSRFDDDDKKR